MEALLTLLRKHNAVAILHIDPIGLSWCSIRWTKHGDLHEITGTSSDSIVLAVKNAMDDFMAEGGINHDAH